MQRRPWARPGLRRAVAGAKLRAGPLPRPPRLVVICTQQLEPHACRVQEMRGGVLVLVLGRSQPGSASLEYAGRAFKAGRPAADQLNMACSCHQAGGWAGRAGLRGAQRSSLRPQHRAEPAGRAAGIPGFAWCTLSAQDGREAWSGRVWAGRRTMDAFSARLPLSVSPPLCRSGNLPLLRPPAKPLQAASIQKKAELGSEADCAPRCGRPLRISSLVRQFAFVKIS